MTVQTLWVYLNFDQVVPPGGITLHFHSSFCFIRPPPVWAALFNQLFGSSREEAIKYILLLMSTSMHSLEMLYIENKVVVF